MAIKIFNSITQEKEDFVAQKTIKWYICGPTVYDSSHIGHARTYVTFDMIRAILEQYFGYNVIYVMNITNIDDKILARARELGDDFNKGFHTIIERYEREFFEDMDALNIKRPSVVTRVTEYVEKIKDFVGKIEENGFAYKSNGSVYFDTEAFGRKYKFKPFKRISSDIDDKNMENTSGFPRTTVSRNITPGECRAVGSLKHVRIDPVAEFIAEKRNVEDFALWKKAKEGEIYFDSKWGPGRPGWHIECSAMASDIFGDNIDIHSGGIDLRFPHHENEILQSVACFGKKWVNYFMHTGHLHIDGLKMSKSLKNFITIRDCLKDYTPRQMRLFFALNYYAAPIDYHATAMQNVIVIERKIYTFLSKIKAHKRNFTNLSKEERDAFNYYDNLKEAVHEAFKDDFDIPKALRSILEFIGRIYEHMDWISYDVLNIFYDYIKRILRILRIENEVDAPKCDNNNFPEIICNYRNEVRKAAKEKKDYKHFFKISDEVRERVKEEGYAIEDKGNESVIRKIE